ncbi:patatin-like phospholipase family protein [Roseomonas xinghualingensis]|uniref:patatin-like phospholipase family protein n=1 Tax=Roseomonas xinghualingensis TaxID=2986475 RepID=UPI0021F1CDEF|nr:patatin-like phospholipase family protein [Roseomonas sp. SXEYE001]MCV4208546.1 patatin-like phospholipase family protein [Roseomonas sp. SXEYE001]
MSGPERAEPAQPGMAMVLSGGVALGAYEAGAYQALEEAGGLRPDWLLGSSAGAINAAIIAGNPPERRVERLRHFWASIGNDPSPWTSFWFGSPPETGAWRRAYNEAAAMQTLLLGRPGLFQPRLMPGRLSGAAPALYDLEPLRRRLPECLDFDLLNHPDAPRICVVATDVVSGERVVFDTARGARITPEHLVASCALLPLFAPLEIEGRLLCDGGLASNAPLDLLLAEPAGGPLLCCVVELFAQQGSRPRSLAASAARAGDLAFGNQTRRLLEACAREYRLRALVGRLAAELPPDRRESPEIAPLLAEAEPRELTFLLLGYRAGLDEAGPGKVFDFSHVTLAERWQAGAEAMRKGLRQLEAKDEAAMLAPGLALHELDG